MDYLDYNFYLSWCNYVYYKNSFFFLREVVFIFGDMG